MYRTLNELVKEFRNLQFVTPDEVTRAMEAGSKPEVVYDEAEFTVVSVQHPERGKLFAVCSTFGANIVLS